MTGVQDMLEAREISVVKGGKRILSDVSVRASAGELVVLVGPNGAGKSTLLSILAGSGRPCGDVRWFGRLLPDWSRRTLAQRLAVMEQHESTPFQFLVREFVNLGRMPHRGRATPEIDQRVVRQAMDVTDVAYLADRSVTTLSGGERQRAHMARCLAQIWSRPETLPGDGCALLLDEPTSALDLKQQARLLTAAWAFVRRGGCCIAVLHDLNLASTFADRVVFLVDGRVVEEGPPHATITGPSVRKWYRTDIVTARHAYDSTRELIALPTPSSSS